MVSGGRLADYAAGMAAALAHRGPDDQGIWCDPAQGIALAHRRLAIIDLSPAGSQPMLSSCGRYALVFNGEIYNHLVLRRELEEGFSWQGHSDTETLLACIVNWGLRKTLEKLAGMFALALWDRRENRLFLARDRMGEKPLYYGWVGDGFAFASELRALRRIPGFSNDISRDALCLYLRHACVPAPWSVYRHIFKLEPGCVLEMDGNAPGGVPVDVPRAPWRSEGMVLYRYWSLRDMLPGEEKGNEPGEKERLRELESSLAESVRLQSVADVPLGTFLSGGIDSSLITALMQRHHSQPVQTFSIGFEEAAWDEAPYARAVAGYLGTRHTELYLSATQAMEVIPGLPDIYDEPFADSSQIPTFLVARMTGEHVRVALSGDGGDELFGGYTRYIRSPDIWRRFSGIPKPLRRPLLRLLSMASRGLDDSRVSGRWLAGRLGVSLAGEKLRKLGTMLDSVEDMDGFYLAMVSRWRDPAAVVVGGKEPDSLLRRREEWPLFSRVEQRMMYLDAMTYLPDDILVKVDRAAMAVGLETRAPFLDHRVVKQAWQLPMDMKIRDGQGKWALRQILYRYLPREMVERPKQGFGIPLARWLRGPLRDWAETLLDEGRLTREGWFRAFSIRQSWEAHLAGRQDNEHALWPVLMFQAWLDRLKEDD